MEKNNPNGSEIKPPIKFSQPSESTPAKTIIVHMSKMESFIASLNPASSLYEDVTDEEDVRECFNNLKEYLKTKNIQLITVEDALLLKGKEDVLMQLAKDCLTYEREDQELKEETNQKGLKSKDSFHNYCFYTSEKYKENVLKKF